MIAAIVPCLFLTHAFDLSPSQLVALFTQTPSMKGKPTATSTPRTHPAQSRPPPGRPQDQSPTKENEVSAFLAQIGLGNYSSRFLSEGIEDLETLHELTETHLTSLGLPLGHRLKLIKRLKEVRSGEKESSGLVEKEGREERKTEGEKGQSTYEMYKVAIEEFRKMGMKDKEERPIPMSSPFKSPLPKPTSDLKPQPVTVSCSHCHSSVRKNQAEYRNGNLFCSLECINAAQKPLISSQNEIYASESEGNPGLSEGNQIINESKPQVNEEIVAVSPPQLVNPTKVVPRLKKKPAIPSKPLIPAEDEDLLRSSEQVKGWDAPVEASFDFGRNGE